MDSIHWQSGTVYDARWVRESDRCPASDYIAAQQDDEFAADCRYIIHDYINTKSGRFRFQERIRDCGKGIYALITANHGLMFFMKAGAIYITHGFPCQNWKGPSNEEIEKTKRIRDQLEE